MASIKATFPVNRDTVNLIYLASAMKLDPEVLLFLYEKYKEDVFYFIYLMAGRKITIPDLCGLVRCKDASERMYYSITSGKYPHQPLLRDKLAYECIKTYLVEDGNEFKFKIDFDSSGEPVKKMYFGLTDGEILNIEGEDLWGCVEDINIQIEKEADEEIKG